MLTLGLFLAPFALAALVAGVLAAVGAGFAVSHAAFAVASLLLMFAVKTLPRVLSTVLRWWIVFTPS